MRKYYRAQFNRTAGTVDSMYQSAKFSSLSDLVQYVPLTNPGHVYVMEEDGERIVVQIFPEAPQS